MDFEEAIGRLPDGVATGVRAWHDIEGYRHEEIADMLGIVAGTSKSQLHHGPHGAPQGGSSAEGSWNDEGPVD